MECKSEFMSVKDRWSNSNLKLCVDFRIYEYGGGIALNLMSFDSKHGWYEPYASLTVNLEGRTPTTKMCAFLDTNNYPQGEKLVKKYKLAKRTDRLYEPSGFCVYPEYEFDLEELKKYCMNAEDIDKFVERIGK